MLIMDVIVMMQGTAGLIFKEQPTILIFLSTEKNTIRFKWVSIICHTMKKGVMFDFTEENNQKQSSNCKKTISNNRLSHE